MRKKKGPLFLVGLVIFFQLAACGQPSSEIIPIVSTITLTPLPTYTPYPTDTPIQTHTPFVPVTSADISYPGSSLSLTIHFPGNYALVKGDEENRRGSFLHYKFEPSGDFMPANDPYFAAQPPYFYEVQFFDEGSISGFLQRCATLDLDGMACFEGDYPDLERYYAQKEALENARGYGDYVLKRFGNEYYLTSTIGCGGGYCNLREYTTFIDNIKMDVWILMHPSDVEAQTELSDKLFRSFYFESPP
jgi:hypothetical protein